MPSFRPQFVTCPAATGDILGAAGRKQIIVVHS